MLDPKIAASSFTTLNRKDRRRFWQRELRGKGISFDEFNKPIPKQQVIKKK